MSREEDELKRIQAEEALRTEARHQAEYEELMRIRAEEKARLERQSELDERERSIEERERLVELEERERRVAERERRLAEMEQAAGISHEDTDYTGETDHNREYTDDTGYSTADNNRYRNDGTGYRDKPVYASGDSSDDDYSDGSEDFEYDEEEEGLKREEKSKKSQQQDRDRRIEEERRRLREDLAAADGVSYDDDEPVDTFKRKKKKDAYDDTRSSKKKRKKRRKGPIRRFLRFVLVMLLIFCLLVGLVCHHIVSKFDHIDTTVSERATSMKGTHVNFLLIGQDAREGESQTRSDSMILVSIDLKTRHAALISLMRDMYVEIPGYGSNRINAAYAYGGVDLLDATIEQNFGITIDGNAIVDLDGFLSAMTAIGNLDIELTAEEAAYLNANTGLGTNNDTATGEVWNLTEGVNSLTPSQALAYSRIRYVGNSDWERTERQRTVINAVFDKIKSGHLLAGFRMVSSAAPSVSTDISDLGFTKCVLMMILCGGFDSYRIPVDGSYTSQTVDGMAVLVPDISANTEYLQQFMDGTYEEETE